MSENAKTLVTPKFLTVRMAEDAVHAALEVVYGGLLRGNLEPHREHLHVVVMVPAENTSEDFRWHERPIEPVVLYEYSRGNPDDFEYEFVGIARDKARQLWTERNDDRTDIIPHLLFPGDTPYWGGVKRAGIVVACSGLRPWIDRLISGMVVDILIAIAHATWENSPDRREEVSFLT